MDGWAAFSDRRRATLEMCITDPAAIASFSWIAQLPLVSACPFYVLSANLKLNPMRLDDFGAAGQLVVKGGRSCWLGGVRAPLKTPPPAALENVLFENF